MKLIGIGVGPGDPELVTVKAVRVLREADLALVPVMALDEPGRAESVVRVYTDPHKTERVVFALSDRGGVTTERAAAWDGAADRVVRAFDEGAGTVAFATIGDPNLYSTFTYLAQTVRARRPGTIVETVPGITAMQDLAARSGTVLTEGAESLGLVPLTKGVESFRKALGSYDTVVAYKLAGVVGRSHGGAADEVLDTLKNAGRLDDAVYGARLGLPGEDVRPARELTGPVPYLSTLIVPARRTTRGGKL